MNKKGKWYYWTLAVLVLFVVIYIGFLVMSPSEQDVSPSEQKTTRTIQATVDIVVDEIKTDEEVSLLCLERIEELSGVEIESCERFETTPLDENNPQHLELIQQGEKFIISCDCIQVVVIENP